MKDEGKGVGLLIGIGKKPDEESADDRKMAAKAMFKALKRDDFDGFYDALCMLLDDEGTPASSGDDEDA